jgi:hypothetical protein
LEAMRAIAAAAVALAVLAPAAFGAKPRPDLTVRSVGPLPVSAAAPGGKLALTETTRNGGNARAGASQTGWYLSIDRIRNKGDRRIARRRVGALKPKRSSQRKTTVTLPAMSGDFFLMACADDARRVRERSERNNCRASAKSLRIGAGSKLPGTEGTPGGTEGTPGGGGGGDTTPGGGGGTGVVNPETPPPVVGGCQVFPANNAWNRDISAAEVDPDSDKYLKYMAANPAVSAAWNLRLDLGSTEEFYGIPWALVPQAQPLVALAYGVGSGANWMNDPDPGELEDYGDESDPGPFPFPPDIHIEGGSAADPDPNDGDRHAIAIRQGDCKLFETYKTMRPAPPGRPEFYVASSADWDLTINDTRPAGWTSADAAGLPIFPGLLRHEEIGAGAINHALRFTAPKAQKAYTAPASHFGPNNNPCMPYYGLRMRLASTWDETPYSAEGRVFIRALKRFGLMYADQGSSGFVSGTSHPSLAGLIEEINQTKRIPSSAFQVVKPGGAITRGYTPAGPCAG